MKAKVPKLGYYHIFRNDIGTVGHRTTGAASKVYDDHADVQAYPPMYFPLRF